MKLPAARVQSFHSLARHQRKKREDDDRGGEADSEVEHGEVVHPCSAANSGNGQRGLSLVLIGQCVVTLFEDLVLLARIPDSVRETDPREKREDDADDDHDKVGVVIAGGDLVLEVEGVRDAPPGSAGPAFAIGWVCNERPRHARMRAGMFVAHGESEC
jgi:hypothetical protein